jgi:hypothetical protein
LSEAMSLGRQTVSSTDGRGGLVKIRQNVPEDTQEDRGSNANNPTPIAQERKHSCGTQRVQETLMQYETIGNSLYAAECMNGLGDRQ